MPRTSRFSKVATAAHGGRAGGRHIRAPDEHNRPPMSTPMRLGVVMEPIGAISYAEVSRLAMLLAAQARGFQLSYLEQRDLLLRDGVALGRMRTLTVRADPA